MKLAVGTKIDSGVDLSKISPKDYIKKLMEDKFNGYICITTHGKYGIEDGVVVFHDGKITCAEYIYLSFDKIYKSDDALKRFLNAMLGFGILDCFSLTMHQSHLITIMYEENRLSEPFDIKRLEKEFPEKFDEKYEEMVVPEKTKNLSVEIRKKLGLSYEIEKESSSETTSFLKKIFGGKL